MNPLKKIAFSLCSLLLTANYVHSQMYIDVTQADDYTITYTVSGSLDTTGIESINSSGSLSATVHEAADLFAIDGLDMYWVSPYGGLLDSLDDYGIWLVTGTINVTEGSDSFGLSNNTLLLPYNYVSDTQLSGSFSVVYDSATTIDEAGWMGDDNTYVFPIASGADQHLTIRTGIFAATAVPEPSTYAVIMGILACGTVFIRRRRQK